MGDEFDDDDDSFALLPDDTLLQLEQNAISSTQISKTAPPNIAQPPRIRAYGTTGLNRSNGPGKSSWRPPQPRHTGPSRGATGGSTSHTNGTPQPPSSSDYGFEDEDVVDLHEPSAAIPQSTSNLPTRGRTEPPPNRPQQPPARYTSKKPLDPETEAAYAAADAELAANADQWRSAPHLRPQTHTTNGDASPELTALQARLAALEAAHNQLLSETTAAQNAAQQKAGEIAIVRANQAKAGKEYERRIAVMQKLHAEESGRLKAEVEASRKERERVDTERRFLAHEFGVVQERERERKGKERDGEAGHRAVNGNSTGSRSTSLTPKKGKSLRTAMLGDGFEVDEVRLVSPSRSKDKDKERGAMGEQTPKAGNKRKRSTMQDSPVPALSFSGPAPIVREETARSAGSDAAAFAHSVAQDQDAKFEFMQRLLVHCPGEGEQRSLETLTKTFFPSDYSKSLASQLLDGLSSIRLHPGVESEPINIQLCRSVLRLWSQCLQEDYYIPLYLLLDLITFALTLEHATSISKLTPTAVPLCIRTIEKVANDTARATLYPSWAAGDEHKKFRAETEQYIDVDTVLDLLRQLCDAASLTRETCERFWSSVDAPFVLLMLNKAQPLEQIVVTLRLLATSSFENSFGPIYAPSEGPTASEMEQAEKQAAQENGLIDRLTSLLLDLPITPAEEPAYTDVEIQTLRVENLTLLRKLCLTEHGSMLLTHHRNAIGRLVRFLDGQIGRLYTTRPSLGRYDPAAKDSETDSSLSSPPHPQYAHDLISRSINLTTRLLHHLLQPMLHPSQPPTEDNKEPLDLLPKRQTTSGGYHKFLTSFTRLAFSDQLVLEHGIEEQVVEAAHAILDAVLSPEEGEAVVRAVETPRGTDHTRATEGPESLGS